MSMASSLSTDFVLLLRPPANMERHGTPPGLLVNALQELGTVDQLVSLLRCVSPTKSTILTIISVSAILDWYGWPTRMCVGILLALLDRDGMEMAVLISHALLTLTTMDQCVSALTPAIIACLGRTGMGKNVSIIRILAPRAPDGMDQRANLLDNAQMASTLKELPASLFPSAVFLLLLGLMESAMLDQAAPMEPSSLDLHANPTLNVRMARCGTVTSSNASAPKELDGVDFNV